MRQLQIFKLVFLLAMVITITASAGEGDGKKERYFKLDPNLTVNDYMAGSVYIKLKPEHKQVFSGVGTEANRVADLFASLNVRSVKPLASPQAIEAASQRRARPFSVDISLFHEVQFSPDRGVEEVINEIYALGVAEFVEPNYTYRRHLTPNDPEIGRQNYLEIIKAFDAWDVTTGNGEVVIAIVDSGMDLDHPDLASRIYINEDEIPDNGIDDDADGYIDNVNGWDFAGADFENVVPDNDPQVTDQVDNSHGVAVAGCAAAAADNEVGIAGVGFSAKIMPLKHSADNDERDNGGGLILNSLAGILFAANTGADIINASFGGPGRSAIAEEIYRSATFDQNVLVVSSSGNSNSNEPAFPSDYPGVLSVSATDNNDAKADFSNHGNKVDISAPGVGIYTTTFDDSYTTIQGTSFSSPIVAGAASLVMSHYPELSGYQVGELLRVTADQSFYDNIPNIYNNQMGLGRLDVHAALTKQLPSVRIESAALLNASGNVAQAGDDASLLLEFKNWLWATSSNLEVTISTENRSVNITQDVARVGIIGMEQTGNNYLSPFELTISSAIPENTNVDILVEYRDGEYYDYEFFTVLVNPTYLNLEENNVSTTFSNNGRIGYQDTEQSEGIGYIIEGTNMLYELGLMMGTSSSVLVNNVRDGEGGFDEDFSSNTSISFHKPGSVASAEITGGFDDSGAGGAAIGLDVNYTALAWTSTEDQDYVIIEYLITNNSGADVTDMYVGLYADWDINQNDFKDYADYHAATRTGYVYSGDPSELRYAGIQVLNRDANYFAIDNDEDVAGNPLGVYDGFTDDEKFETMSSGIGKQTAGFSVDGGTDVSHVVSAGPLNIAAGSTETVAFAIHGTRNFDALLASAHAADTMYNLTLQATPPTSANVEVCYEATASLTASGATAYNWYTEISGGDPIATGANFTTGSITSDTVFYVSNANQSYESARTAVEVSVLADPKVQVNGSTRLCEGDAVELSVAAADTYLWSNGETSQTISVTQAGDYSVQVTSDAAGCVSNSETVTITSSPSPTAAFSSDLTAPTTDDVINFTDESTGAVSWFWNFDDGTTSTAQNPTHQYSRSGAFVVSLQVTNAEGCADVSTLEVGVVTGIDPEELLAGVGVFPNPALNILNVSVENELTGVVNIELYDLTGSQVKTKSFTKQSPLAKARLDLAGLDKGIYILHVIQGDKQNIFKVLKD